MSIVNVNLARKWRSRNFDQIVGQELSLRILKNSLYLNCYFPLYLFSGQHGCGKTTTARIFAAAVNCEKLSLFQKNPKSHSIPCLECPSCSAMQQGKHADFIEIDGASNTGVDNVRTIIDASAFLPLLGQKKIYLIDEAHMLSKAAFNAFLKILEEPPASVIFILATTELHKIIDTVKSRAFFLFFKAVPSDLLVEHLKTISEAEQIIADEQGLSTIVKHTKGSVRDAINVLEQVRFESNNVTRQNVLNVIGHSDDETIVALLEHIVRGDPKGLLTFIQDHKLEKFSSSTLLKALMELINACVWVAYGLKPRHFNEHIAGLKKITERVTLSYLNESLELLYAHEHIFSKTVSGWEFLELLLLRLCNKDVGSGLVPAGNDKNPAFAGTPVLSVPKKHQEENVVVKQQPVVNDSNACLWQSFVAQIELFDPMLSSIFKQGSYGGLDEKSNTVTVVYAKEFSFFNEMLESSSSIWKPLLVSLVGKPITFKAVFQEYSHAKNGQTDGEKAAPGAQMRPAFIPKPLSSKSNDSVDVKKNNNTVKKIPTTTLDISDKEQWKKTHLLKTVFSGSIHELQEGTDE